MDKIRKQLTVSNGTQVVIRYTDLSNIIEEVFDELIKFKDTLTELILRNCYLRYIPDTIGNLTQLTVFDCSHNQLEFLPDTIGNLTQLTHFCCYHNQLEFLPDTIGNLTQLIDFSCSFNQLEYLPISMKFLEKLNYFRCDIDKIQNLDEDVYEKGGYEIIKWMQKNYSPMVKAACKK